MSTVSCCACGTDICLTYEQEHELLRTRGSFYCPSGHRQHFTDGCSHEQTLKRERAEWERTRERLDRRLQEARDEALTCPWPTCRRSAIRHIYSRPDNLIAHMERAHGMPTYREHLKVVAS